MRILLTGGAGRVGSATLKRLIEHGCDVRVIDSKLDAPMDGIDYRVCDINDFKATREVMRGIDAVIHLAAIPAPTLATGHEVFRINVAGTFNVFEAAAQEGVERVVQASSINALGCAYSLVDMRIDYLPIDEQHPIYTTDPYSLSKQMAEEIGDYYWRRSGISSTSMRFPWVYPHDTLSGDWFRRRWQRNRTLFDELSKLSESERTARLAEARTQALEYRQRRPLEYVDSAVPIRWEVSEIDPLWWAYAHDRFNFWTMIDERDAAQALEKAVTANYEGAHALFVTDDHNWLGVETQTLADWFFPDVRWIQPPVGTSSLLNIEKARTLIGFEPEHSAALVSFA